MGRNVTFPHVGKLSSLHFFYIWVYSDDRFYLVYFSLLTVLWLCFYFNVCLWTLDFCATCLCFTSSTELSEDSANYIRYCTSGTIINNFRTWNLMGFFYFQILIYNYSGTCAIQHLSFPTSCDIRQQFLVQKIFFNSLC